MFVKMKEMIGGCCVCGDECGYVENPIVYCDGEACTVAVHQACYGIVNVPKGDWFCRPCESKVKSAKCELCPLQYGALKPTDNGKWVHVVCALYIPEITFGNINSMEPIMLDYLKNDRLHRSCILCEMAGRETSKARCGACTACHYPNCPNFFHVTCAQLEGLLCEEDSHNYNVKYSAFCPNHIQKRKKSHVRQLPAYNPPSISTNSNNSFQRNHKTHSLNLSSSSTSSSASSSPVAPKKVSEPSSSKNLSQQHKKKSSSSFSLSSTSSSSSNSTSLPNGSSSSGPNVTTSKPKLDSTNKDSSMKKISKNNSASTSGVNYFKHPKSSFSMSSALPTTSFLNNVSVPRKRTLSSSSSSSSSSNSDSDSSSASDSESGSDSSSSSKSTSRSSSKSSDSSGPGSGSQSDSSSEHSSQDSDSSDDEHVKKAKSKASTISGSKKGLVKCGSVSANKVEPTNEANKIVNNNTIRSSVQSSSINSSVRKNKTNVLTPKASSETNNIKSIKKEDTGINQVTSQPSKTKTKTSKSNSAPSNAKQNSHVKKENHHGKVANTEQLSSKTNLSSLSSSNTSTLKNKEANSVGKIGNKFSSSNDDVVEHTSHRSKNVKSSKIIDSSSTDDEDNNDLKTVKTSKANAKSKQLSQRSKKRTNSVNIQSNKKISKHSTSTSNDHGENKPNETIHSLVKANSTLPSLSTNQKKSKKETKSKEIKGPDPITETLSSSGSKIDLDYNFSPPSRRRSSLDQPIAKSNSSKVLSPVKSPPSVQLSRRNKPTNFESSCDLEVESTKSSVCLENFICSNEHELIPPVLKLSREEPLLTSPKTAVDASSSKNTSIPMEISHPNKSCETVLEVNVEHNSLLNSQQNNCDLTKTISNPELLMMPCAPTNGLQHTQQTRCNTFNPLMVPQQGVNITPFTSAAVQLSPSLERPPTPKSLEELLEFQWIHSSHFLLAQDENHDVSLLVQKLNSLVQENTKLEKNVKTLNEKYQHFQMLNSKLKNLLLEQGIADPTVEQSSSVENGAVQSISNANVSLSANNTTTSNTLSSSDLLTSSSSANSTNNNTSLNNLLAATNNFTTLRSSTSTVNCTSSSSSAITTSQSNTNLSIPSVSMNSSSYSTGNLSNLPNSSASSNGHRENVTNESVHASSSSLTNQPIVPATYSSYLSKQLNSTSTVSPHNLPPTSGYSLPSEIHQSRHNLASNHLLNLVSNQLVSNFENASSTNGNINSAHFNSMRNRSTPTDSSSLHHLTTGTLSHLNHHSISNPNLSNSGHHLHASQSSTFYNNS